MIGSRRISPSPILRRQGNAERSADAESDEAADVPLSELEGMNPATVAVLNEAGYRTLNDIIDLERDDFLRLAGIAPQEADRIIAFLDELTTEETSSDEGRKTPQKDGAVA